MESLTLPEENEKIPAMIEFKNVSKKYSKESAALDGVSFLIDRGSFTFLMGPTGSGKTTIFRLIIRDLLPTEGQILLGELDLRKISSKKIPHLRRKVGVIFQDLKLLMDRTVAENVYLPLQFTGVKEKEARARAREILAEVGLDDRMDYFPLQLSGGERQRVAIARALVYDPEVLLADEPTGNLDMDTSFQILDLLQSINKKGTTVFMATHNDQLLQKADNRVIILRDGKIAEDRHPKQSAKKSEHVKPADASPEDARAGKEEHHAEHSQ